MTGWSESLHLSQPEQLSASDPPNGPTAGAMPTATSSGSKRWKSGGDPVATAKVLAGLLGVVALSLKVWAARRSVEFRAPTSGQLDDVTVPVARILVRHLPMDLINDDLADLAEAGAAMHSYVLPEVPAPLLRRRPPAEAPIGLEEYQP